MVWTLHGKGLLVRVAAVGTLLRRCQKLPHTRQRQFWLTLEQTPCWDHQWFWEHLSDDIFKNKLSSPSWVYFDHDSNFWVIPLSLSRTTKPLLYFLPLSCWWRRSDRMSKVNQWQNEQGQPRSTHHSHSCMDVTVLKGSTHPEALGSSLIIIWHLVSLGELALLHAEVLMDSLSQPHSEYCKGTLLTNEMEQEERYNSVFMYTYMHPSSLQSNPRIHKPLSATKFWTNFQFWKLIETFFEFFWSLKNQFLEFIETILILLSTNLTELENIVGDTLADNLSEQTNKV